MSRRSRDGRVHPAAALGPPGLPAFPTAGPRIRRARANRDAHHLKHDLIIFSLSDPKPALSLHQMHPKGKGERAAERSALRSNRLPIPCVRGLYTETIFRYGPVGLGRGHSRGSLLPQSCGSPCESQPVPPLWTAAHADRVIDGGTVRNLQFRAFQVSPAGDTPERRDSPGQP